jgi:hypothetical protein
MMEVMGYGIVYVTVSRVLCCLIYVASRLNQIEFQSHNSGWRVNLSQIDYKLYSIYNSVQSHKSVVLHHIA